MSIKPDTNTWSGIEMEAGVSPMNIVPDTKHGFRREWTMALMGAKILF